MINKSPFVEGKRDAPDDVSLELIQFHLFPPSLEKRSQDCRISHSNLKILSQLSKVDTGDCKKGGKKNKRKKRAVLISTTSPSTCSSHHPAQLLVDVTVHSVWSLCATPLWKHSPEWTLLCLSTLPYVSYAAAAGASWPRVSPVVVAGGDLELGSTLHCAACCKAKKLDSSLDPNCKATFSQPSQVCAQAPGVVQALRDVAFSSFWHSQNS